MIEKHTSSPAKQALPEYFRYALYRAVLLFVSLLCSCAFAYTRHTTMQEQDEYIRIAHGREAFLELLESYDAAKGILPYGIDIEEGEHTFLYKPSLRSHEFFVFDPDKLLLFLSVEPACVLEIQAPFFYSHLLNEWDQIRRGKSGRDKSQSTKPFLKAVGNFFIEVYFSPKEVNFGYVEGRNKNRIRQSGVAKAPPYLWRLIDAAQDLEASYPIFADEQMDQDFQAQIAMGKNRRLQARAFSFPEPLPDYARKLSRIPAFTYFVGRNLEATPDLLDGEKLRGEELSKIRQDFLALFSLIPGNPGACIDNTCTGALPQTTALNTKDGIMVLLRGPLNELSLLEDIEACATEQTPDTSIPVIISEAGNKLHDLKENDYVVLYNRSSQAVYLQGLYLHRDSKCSLASWTESVALPDEEIAPYSYYLIRRPSQSTPSEEPLLLDADFSGWKSGALGSDYCLALSISSAGPIGPDAEGVWDFVSFHEGSGEGGTRAGALRDDTGFVRKGLCAQQDSNNNADDFIEKTEGEPPRSKDSLPCMPQADSN